MTKLNATMAESMMTLRTTYSVSYGPSRRGWGWGRRSSTRRGVGGVWGVGLTNRAPHEVVNSVHWDDTTTSAMWVPNRAPRIVHSRCSSHGRVMLQPRPLWARAGEPRHFAQEGTHAHDEHERQEAQQREAFA